MILSIHQPNFIPWIGYFYKIYKSDVFVILDDVQFTKNSFINRNKIKTPQGDLWLTLPVVQSGKFGQTITDCEVFNRDIIIKKIGKTVTANYAKAPFFSNYYNRFLNAIESAGNNLASININLITLMLEIMEIDTKVVNSSSLANIHGESTDRLVSICSELDANQYLSGFGGQKYQEEELFNSKGIEIVITDFAHPQYDQLWKEFIPNLSIIDLVFNKGPEARAILAGCSS